MEQTQLTTGEYLKVLKVIHIGLTGGVVLFLLIAMVLQLTGFEPELKELEEMLLAITGAGAVAGVFTGNLLFRKKLEQLVELKSLKEKLMGYQSALIIKYALVEGPAFFSVVAYLLTANFLFPGVTLILIFILILYAPGKDKLTSDLNLSKSETDLLDNPHAVLK